MAVVIVEGKGQFQGKCGAFYCNQWGLLRSCARTTLSFQITLGELVTTSTGLHMGTSRV